jgi:hypothetical protein
MTENQMKHKLYGLYQLDWMMSHDYSLADLMAGMTNIPEYHDEYISSYPDDDHAYTDGMKADIEGIFRAWEFDSDAFGGECWVCFSEFCGAELTMPEYIQGLLDAAHDKDLAKAYHKWAEENVEE